MVTESQTSVSHYPQKEEYMGLERRGEFPYHYFQRFTFGIN